MKTISLKYILLMLCCVFCASCMNDDWDEPTNEAAEENLGNQYLEESNVLTIAQLRSQYAAAISGTMQKVSKPTQLKVVVTGNDYGGNLYNEISVADETGAILISINQGALYGYLPVGTTILIELNGLYIGGYENQATIGGYYTSTSGNVSVGRMSRELWRQHYKIANAEAGKLQTVTPLVVTDVKSLDLDKDQAKLITLKGVSIVGADGKATFAPQDGSIRVLGNAVNRNLSGISSSKLQIRTSIYADFAGNVMPQGKLDITGIVTRYRNQFQLLPRSLDDIKAAQ